MKKSILLLILLSSIVFSKILSLEENLSLNAETLEVTKKGKKLFKKLKSDFVKNKSSNYFTYFNLDWTSKSAFKNIQKVSKLPEKDIRDLLDSVDYIINNNPILFMEFLIKASNIEEQKAKKDIRNISKELTK